MRHCYVHDPHSDYREGNTIANLIVKTEVKASTTAEKKHIQVSISKFLDIKIKLKL